MKNRMLSAFVMLIIIVPIVLVGGDLYKYGLMVISALAYKEIIDIKGVKDVPLIIKGLGLISFLLLVTYTNVLFSILLLVLPMVFYNGEKIESKDIFYLLGLILIVGIGFNGLLIARSDIHYLVYLILITTLSDTFAYIIGSLIGKHKLCPSISPKKSIEGSIAGLIAGASVPLIYFHNMISPINSTIIIVTIVLAVISQIGDILFSKIKRDNKIKDFSSLIPGHGGILDRLDSILLVALAFIAINGLL